MSCGRHEMPMKSFYKRSQSLPLDTGSCLTTKVPCPRKELKHFHNFLTAEAI